MMTDDDRKGEWDEEMTMAVAVAVAMAMAMAMGSTHRGKDGESG